MEILQKRPKAGKILRGGSAVNLPSNYDFQPQNLEAEGLGEGLISISFEDPAHAVIFKTRVQPICVKVYIYVGRVCHY